MLCRLPMHHNDGFKAKISVWVDKKVNEPPPSPHRCASSMDVMGGFFCELNFAKKICDTMEVRRWFHCSLLR